MKRIDVVHCHNCEKFHLEIWGDTFFIAPQEGVVKRVARIFEEAINMPFRNAIHHMMTEIGYNEDEARKMLARLHDGMQGSNPNTVN